MRRTARERFDEKVIKRDGCWGWRAGIKRNGYGELFLDGRGMAASRAAWILARGPLPPTVFVCHKCDTPECTRPDHLFIGTQADNLADMRRKRRDYSRFRGVTHCKRGHEFTPENTYLRKGLRYCRTCRTQANAEYRKAHPERCRQYDKRSYAKKLAAR